MTSDMMLAARSSVNRLWRRKKDLNRDTFCDAIFKNS
jgi:hypothetical protein